MSDPIPVTDIWAYLTATPLLGLTITLTAYVMADWIYKKAGKPPILIPVLPAMIFVVIFLFITGIDYPTYFEGAQFVHFMLGPATVALAIPLYNNLATVKRASLAIIIVVPVGAVVAAVSAVALAYSLGAPEELLLSIAPKSVTNPIAMGVTERLGGLPSLTAVMVLSTGFFGVIIAGPLFKLIGVKCDRSKGMALGMGAHGIGTAQAIQMSEETTAFAGLGMSLNGLATAVLVPLLFALWW